MTTTPTSTRTTTLTITLTTTATTSPTTTTLTSTMTTSETTSTTPTTTAHPKCMCNQCCVTSQYTRSINLKNHGFESPNLPKESHWINEQPPGAHTFRAGVCGGHQTLNMNVSFGVVIAVQSGGKTLSCFHDNNSLSPTYMVCSHACITLHLHMRANLWGLRFYRLEIRAHGWAACVAAGTPGAVHD